MVPQCTFDLHFPDDKSESIFHVLKSCVLSFLNTVFSNLFPVLLINLQELFIDSENWPFG